MQFNWKFFHLKLVSYTDLWQKYKLFSCPIVCVLPTLLKLDSKEFVSCPSISIAVWFNQRAICYWYLFSMVYRIQNAKYREVNRVIIQNWLAFLRLFTTTRFLGGLSLHLNHFLGGLSLHLNHLIASRMGISFRQFGTLPIGIFLSNLDSRHLMTSPRTLLGQFWHMSIFGDSRVIWVICQKKMPSENHFFLDEGAMGLQSVSWFVGGQIPRLYGGTILGGVRHT